MKKKIRPKKKRRHKSHRTLITYMPTQDMPRKTRHRWSLSIYKLELGCNRCGYNKCAAALTFHHVDKSTKLFNLGDSNRILLTLSELEEELKKCELLCLNCHAEEEYQ